MSYFILAVLFSYQKKDIFFSSKSLLYVLIIVSITCNGLNFFTIFVTNKIFKAIFTGKNFVWCYYLINIYIIYQKLVFILVKFVFFNSGFTKLYNFFYLFLIYDKQKLVFIIPRSFRSSRSRHYAKWTFILELNNLKNQFWFLNDY